MSEVSDARGSLEAAYQRSRRSEPLREALRRSVDGLDDAHLPLSTLAPDERIVATLEVARHRPSRDRTTALLQGLLDDPRMSWPSAELGPVAPAFVVQSLADAIGASHPFCIHGMASALHAVDGLVEIVARSIAAGDLEPVRELRDNMMRFHDPARLGEYAPACALATLALDEADRDDRLRTIVLGAGASFAGATVEVIARPPGSLAPVSGSHPALQLAVERLRYPDFSWGVTAIMGALRGLGAREWLSEANALAQALAKRGDESTFEAWIAVAGLACSAGDADLQRSANEAAREAYERTGAPFLVGAVACNHDAIDPELLAFLVERKGQGARYLGERGRLAAYMTDRERARALLGRREEQLELALCLGDHEHALSLCRELDVDPPGLAIGQGDAAISNEGLDQLLAFVVARRNGSRDEVARAFTLAALVEQARRRGRVDGVAALVQAAETLFDPVFRSCHRSQILTDVATLLDGEARIECIERALRDADDRIPWSDAEHEAARVRARATVGDRAANSLDPEDPLVAAVRDGEAKAAVRLVKAIKNGLERAARIAEVLSMPSVSPELASSLVALAVACPKAGLKRHEIVARDAQVARAIILGGTPTDAAALSDRVRAVAETLDDDAVATIVQAYDQAPARLVVDDLLALARSRVFRGPAHALRLYPHVGEDDRRAMLAALPDPATWRDNAVVARVVAAFRAGEPWRELRPDARRWRDLDVLDASDLVSLLVRCPGPERREVVSWVLSVVSLPPTRERRSLARLVAATVAAGEPASWADLVASRPGETGDDALYMWITEAPFVADDPIAVLDAVREVSLRSLPMARLWVAWRAVALALVGREGDATGTYELATSSPPFSPS